MHVSQSDSLVSQQVQLLTQFARVANALKGVAAVLWLPGLKRRFDGPRRVTGTRPLAVSLEVTQDGGLILTGAVSRPKNKKMTYDVILRYDFTQPMSEDARGEVLTTKNEVLARRAISLLRSLVRFGEKRAYQPRSVKLGEPRHPLFLVPFNPGEEQIDEAKLTEIAADNLSSGLDGVEAARAWLREQLCDRESLPGTVLVDARICQDSYISQAIERELGYESFEPVLGVNHWNPACSLFELQNPARRLLQDRDVGELAQDQVDQLVAEFRTSVLLGERLTEEEIFDAICNPDNSVRCAAGVADIPAARVVEAMRIAAGNSRAAWEATDDDMLTAAQNPGQPLVLSRLSATQIVAAADLAALPEPYAGDFLSPIDWQPPRRRAAIAA